MLGGILFNVFIGSLTVLVAVYFYAGYRHSYWNRKNVKGPKPVPIFGNFMETILRQMSIHEKFRDSYLAWKHEPFIGLYQLTTPILLINDPALIKQILIKDFSTFGDRGFLVNEHVDPLSANLLALGGQRWKGLRHKLTPLFTSGKLKQMYHLLNECADVFEKFMETLVAKGEPIEVRDITAKFTTDVIGSCAFGLNLNALSNEDGEFRKIGKRVLSVTPMRVLKEFVKDFAPGLFKLLKIRDISEEDTKFFMGSIAETIAYRKKNGIVRHDFIDLMTQLQEKPDGIDFELTDELLAAQAYIFFLAGFETSSTTMSYALYELALHQDIQDKLRVEICDALKIHNGKLPYEAVNELKYLDKIYRETLRKNPAATFLIRTSAKNYTIPDTKVQIPAGIRVFVSILGLHHDPQYYPNPEIFDPERFSDEAIQRRPQMVYLPFGDGPRNCIGARFANYQSKMGLIRILKNYRVTISPKTEVPYRLSTYPIILTPLDGIHLNFTKIA